MDDPVADTFTSLRPELVRYLTRLTGRPDAAEDTAQSTYVRARRAGARAPSDRDALRPWLFRIATNLALDELRRVKRWRSTDVTELRDIAESNPAFMERSASMARSLVTGAGRPSTSGPRGSDI